MNIVDYTLKGVKAYLKNLAKIIRIKKHLRKDAQNQHVEQFSAEDLALAATIQPSSWDTRGVWLISNLKAEYRSLHIAYCEFRGKTREQIESKVTEGNEPNESQIKTNLEMISAAMEVYRKDKGIDAGDSDA